MEEHRALTTPEPDRVRSWLARLAHPRPMAIALVFVMALIAWQWYDARLQMSGLREEMALRLRDSSW